MISHPGRPMERHASRITFGRSRAFALVAGLALTLGFLTGCGGDGEGRDGEALTKTIPHESGLEMKVPASWREDRELNQEADLQASNRQAEAYVIVIPDLKQQFVNQRLEDFATAAKDNFIKGVQNASVSDPRPLTLNGRRAIRYEIQGTSDNVRVVYLMTLMETDTRFLQVIAWSLPERMEQNRRLLENITASVRETKPASPSPPPGAPPPAPPAPPAP